MTPTNPPASIARDLDSRQLAAVLAGLRALQRGSTAGVWDIASDDGSFEPLSPQEIDDLAERLNTTAPAAATRVVLMADGGVLNEAFADGSFELLVLDADTEGGDESQIANIEGDDVYVTQFSNRGDPDAAREAERVQAIFQEARLQLGAFDEEVLASDEHLEPKPSSRVVDAAVPAPGPMSNEAVDRLLSLTVPGGSQVRAERGLENVRYVVRRMVEAQRSLEAHCHPVAADQQPALLESCSTVSRLLRAVQRALAHVADPTVRQDLLNHLEPFTQGVAVAFYSRSEMAQQAPMDVEVTDAEADAALERLVRNFQHPWDMFPGQFSEEVFARGRGELKAASRPRQS
ncbi:MAG TPA: hypothetical protein VN259_07510 [Xanthomonadales bacterium]|nr:hypothetical protein [Xanthomonadales bacterium]